MGKIIDRIRERDAKAAEKRLMEMRPLLMAEQRRTLEEQWRLRWFELRGTKEAAPCLGTPLDAKRR